MTRDRSALVRFIDARAAASFAWGRSANDCVSFAAGAAQAQTGINPLDPQGWDWDSEGSGLALLDAEGGLMRVCDKMWKRTPKAMAARGDVAMVRGPRGAFLMIVEGDLLVGPGPEGQLRLPRSAMTLAWSIG